jgi:hypothetical protein
VCFSTLREKDEIGSLNVSPELVRPIDYREALPVFHFRIFFVFTPLQRIVPDIFPNCPYLLCWSRSFEELFVGYNFPQLSLFPLLYLVQIVLVLQMKPQFL